MTQRIQSNPGRIALAGMFLLPLVAISQTTTIVRDISSGQMDLMTVPLIVPGGNTISNIFKNVPSGSQFYFWDDPLHTWTASFGSSKNWYNIGSRQVLPGGAFFFKPPGAWTVALTGTPPESPVSTPVNGNTKISVLGYPYPADIPWPDTQLAALLPPGSRVSFWHPAYNSFHTTFFKAPAAKGGGWGSAASNYIVHAGDGFAVWQSGTDFNWVE
jgi:hypothetical protein